MAEALAYWRYFGHDYQSARNKFLSAAKNIEATITSYPHPTEKGPSGETLYIDVAYVGSPSAARVHLAISGTHGLEAAAGSAVQTAWLSDYAQQQKKLPADTAVLFVHVINPYGFAHSTRTTEHNVDLNRNFVDHESSHIENKDYAALHDALIVDQWDEAHLEALEKNIQFFKEKYGEDAYFNARVKGQYDFPGGVAFGGNQREWSNVILEKIVHDHLKHAQQIAFIDWHTGLGEYAEPFFLCFNDEGSLFQKEAIKWWGEHRIIGQRPHGLKRPDYQGLVFKGVEQFLNGRPLVGAVVEFGTRGKNTPPALLLDQWLKFKSDQFPDKERDIQLYSDLKDAYLPISSIWRQSVVRHGVAITNQAIEGLIQWKI